MTPPRPGDAATSDTSEAPAVPADSGRMTEADWEQHALDELGELAWRPAPGREFSPEPEGQRRVWDDLILHNDLRDAVERLNPELTPSAVDQVMTTATTPQSREPLPENHLAHGFLTSGIRLTYTDDFGAEHSPTVRLVDFRDPQANTFRALNQVRLVDGDHERRFDVVLYVNGLPLAVIELKNGSDSRATLARAHAQLGTYAEEFPAAFRYNVLCLVSDGVTAKYGTPFTPFEHFAPWNVDGEGNPPGSPDSEYGEYSEFGAEKPDALTLALHGLFDQARFLDLARNFVNFTSSGSRHGKRVAKAHQYFAVNKALKAVVRASQTNGQAGVVWHTQGSGKSEEMVCLSGLVAREPSLNNPTVVVVTDRNDLDDQLLGTFQASRELLGADPVQADTRQELRQLLANTNTGGIVFTTLQKFGRTKAERESGADHPLLSERRNILVIVDEAHRSHYDNLDGYARHLRDALPHATLLAFTGTPLSKADANTREVFGAGEDYIDVYDLRRAVEDGATVRVYHEPRLIDVSLPKDIDPADLDEQADTLTAAMDDAERRRAMRAAMQMTNIYGAPDRVAKLAQDLVDHWEERSKLVRPYLGSPGKAMLVCANREVCVRMFDALAELRPGWVGTGPDTGVMKVVFHGEPADSPELKAHAMRPSGHRVVQARAKDPDDELQLLIVHSMLLTGYDAPPIHTMYMDRSMSGANLMQALARVNRRFRDKQDGLLVGYAPLSENLRKALAEYSPGDQRDKTLGRDIDRAITEVRNEYETICGLLSGIGWRRLLTASGDHSRLRALKLVSDHLVSREAQRKPEDGNGKSLSQRFRESATKLERFHQLCAMSSQISKRFGDLEHWRRDIAFFVEVRAWVVKLEAANREARGEALPAEISMYLSQLAASAVDAEEITDLYAESGLGRLDITRLNEVQLRRLQASETPNLAVEALHRLAQEKLREATRYNAISRERFTERLEALMIRYMREQLTSAQVLAELFALAQDAVAEFQRGDRFDPPLNHRELAFYDAVCKSESARKLMKDEVLADIARALVKDVAKNLSTDWLSREPVRAKLRSRVRRLLAKFNYPPDQEKKAIEDVIKQMEELAGLDAPTAARR
ncbi:type I restriction endonuclease subunit R [Nocardiopsis sp. CT-R113]|uniref:Type I restriction enzyme endonuclease subunit n=1 Tax=Nocardiopsis codii TaxID=3065942 RepID=A0ABU7K0T7_9ACTN|nr:type I restriction endonuclease subunit R [Nocardiopsis sp. CT-R113]MEE2035784.1 type I restriction endonuclease subunit R [Nocardiopsis sp. CT-R113]